MDENLRGLGFTDNDIAVYKTILQMRRILPARISAETGINRSTVYSIVKSLKKRGLVAEDLRGRSRYVTALHPKHLIGLTKKDETELENKKKLISETVEELSKLTRGSSLPIPKIRYVEESDLREFLMKEISKWHKSTEKYDSTWWGFQDYTVIKLYPDVVDYSFKIAPDKKVKFFSNNAPEERKFQKKQYKGRSIKAAPKSVEYSASVWVAGDYVLMVSTRSNPHYLIEMHDPLLASNMREHFKSTWEKD